MEVIFMEYLKIKDINSIQIIDSRGNPTLQVTATLENNVKGTAMVPSGASTGSFEAIELRDNNKERFQGKSVFKAIDNVNKLISHKLKGENVFNQTKIDNMMINLDGTDNKRNLGANAMLGVSLAVAKAAANAINMQLYRYLGGIEATTLPIPMMNILNGGKHSGNNVNIQEFMIVPIGAKNFEESMEYGTNIYHTLKRILKDKGLNNSIGDEGGFAPNLNSDEEAIELIVEAIKKSGYTPGVEVGIALDIAASEMYQEGIKIGKEEKYFWWKTKETKTTEEMIKYYEKLIDKYPIISIEDGLGEEDWEGWKQLTNKIRKCN